MTRQFIETQADVQKALTDYLAMWETFRAQFGHNTLDLWIGEHGTPIPDNRLTLPESLVHAASNQCYFNAWRYKSRRPKQDLTYCEGLVRLADVPISVLHGWLMDSEGHIIDPSVEQYRPVAYYGMGFDDAFARERWQHLRRNGAIGILGNLYLFRQHPDDIKQHVIHF